MKLSIIIPVYNEEKTVQAILKRVLDAKIPGVEKEIIVVDDGSTDASAAELKTSLGNSRDKQNLIHSASSGREFKNIQIITHKKNLGKGAAVRTGLEKATGEYIVIQDADLEYNPQEIANLIKPILDGKAQVVYGTRLKRLPNFTRDERTGRFLLHYIGNKFLSLLTSLLYFHWVTDMETCYKLFPRKALKGIMLHARGFELEPEITAKLLKRGYKIFDVPISTNPRGLDEGKKLDTVHDGVKAFWTLLKYRFSD
jgi:dolichol-phosphate mannosyltransferase